MKNLFKKISLCLVLMFMFIGSASLVGCNFGNGDKMQVLNLSVNPGVEFIVDQNDKVISVTASNEDGAYILEKFTTFTGMSAKDAALKFLELSEQYGFVVSGSTNGETFTISVSGEGAEDLYNDVKGKIQSKATELGLSIANMVEITKSELKDIVSECYQEYAQSDLADMTEEDLLAMLKQSRIETKDLHTEDERLEYYRDRAKTVIVTKIDEIVEYFNTTVPAAIKPLIQTSINFIENDVKNFIINQYNAIDSLLTEEAANAQAELNNYINTKKDYLAKVQEYRDALELNADADLSNDVANIDELKQQYETLKAQAKTIYDELEDERLAIKTEVMNFVKTTLEAKITLLNSTIDAISEHISLNLNNIENEINVKLTELKNSYVAASENPWNTAE